MWNDRSPERHRRSASMSLSPSNTRPKANASILPNPDTSSSPTPSSPSKFQTPKLPPSSPRPPPLDSLNRHRSSSTGARTATNSGPISPDVTDRVFPMRSFVSVDPTPTPATQQRLESSDSYFGSKFGSNRSRTPSSNVVPTVERDRGQRKSNVERGHSALRGEQEAQTPTERKLSEGSVGQHNVRNTGKGYQIYSDNASHKSESVASSAKIGATSRAGKEGEDSGGLLTARFKHVVTDGGHAVITGRDGETMQRCEDEPIHIPGAVQSFGLLIAFQEESEGKLVVRVVSENSNQIVGYSPKQLFALDSFTDLLSDDQAENLLDHVDFVKDEATSVENDGPEVFTMSIRNERRRAQKLWCAIHTSPSNPDLIICEFELEDDRVNPLVPANEHTPEPPEDTLSSDPTEQELRESTENRSRPLRVLRSARKRKGEAATMEVFNIMSQVQEQLADAPNLDEFLKVLVGVVKELTGFHRVMVYQFDSDWNGTVVTELVDPRSTKDLYKGLHFPASDIPKQARDLYKMNKVRLLYDRDQETSRLVCRTVEDLEHPLDMTHTYLRAMSPIHIKYLRNMSVRSSMSISINAFNELWGLISCHTYGSKGTRVSFPIRKMCRLIGDSACRNIERLSYASRLQARKLINTAPTKQNPSGYIVASSDDLLKLFDADFGLLSIHDETKILGKLEATQEALAMLEYLRLRKFTSVLASQDMRADFSDLKYPPGFSVIAGCLVVPLSVGGSDFIVFFRKAQLKEVKWAGNPYEKFIKEGTEGYLEPRKSFKTWTEKVVGRSRDWTEEETETAAVLCLVYGKFIEVWRQKEIALENSQLTKLLLANSAHEVRTPLNAIINYLEIAMEGSLDQETRENLSRSHSASKSLIYVINDLLDLTKTEANSDLVQEEAFDLKATYHEAVDVFEGEARRKGLKFEVIERPDLPDAVLGDNRKVRQAIANVVANAVQATSEGHVLVEMTVSAWIEGHADIEVIVEDTGSGLSPERLDALFAELEQAQAETNKAIENMIAPDERAIAEDKNTGALGLGLAVVARIIRNMDGQMRVKSERGKGSRFVMQLPFDLPSSNKPSSQDRTIHGPEPATETSGNSLSPIKSEHEITLVRRHSTSSPRESQDVGRPSLSRQVSGGSMHSTKSLTSVKSAHSHSSAKSGADRLIQAMQEPHMVEGPTSPAGTRPTSSKSLHNTPRKSVDFDTGPELDRRPASQELSQRKTPEHLRMTNASQETGQRSITDTNRPLKPIKVPQDDLNKSSAAAYDPKMTLPSEIQTSPERNEVLDADHVNVLVAEDDPINSKLVQKRLQKAGHEVYLTVNGEECSSTYGEKPGVFDVVLMDMQMPIVDGLTSTKMIRSYEKSHPSTVLSARASLNGRVPIIAVSATLEERNKQVYVDAGFDGWILKPINFNRLSELIRGIVEPETRRACVYKEGQWEKGGWFREWQPDLFSAATAPATDKMAFADSKQQSEAQEEEQQRLKKERLKDITG
ncbi:MAG: Light-sensor Protein kinase [Alyxoria varia]|nr:MAG: Light-sensor Protein kinase [Alyxoria varia]